jgi:thiaminase
VGVSEKELEETTETAAMTAYGASTMNIRLQGDTFELNEALSACPLGHGEVGLWLADESKYPDSRVIMHMGEQSSPYRYLPWVREYSGEMRLR